MDYGHMAAMGWPISQWDEPVKWEGGEVYFYQNPLETVTMNDSIKFFNRTSYIKAPAETQFFIEYNLLNEGWLNPDKKVGDWELYDTQGKFYDEQNLTLGNDVVIDGDIGEPIPDYLKDRRSGWYVGVMEYCHFGVYELFIKQDSENIFFIGISGASLRDIRYDQYLLLDGRMFTFTDKDIRPDPEFENKIENISGGWQMTHEMRFKYMDRNFLFKFVDTCYLNP
ncbi:MAG: hypothetical protein J1E57_11020 [Prevotella sp.]|nr:hypothetical protein [Prevotella sp.]